MQKRFIARLTAGAAAIVATTVLAAPATALSHSDRDLLASSRPKTVIIDTTTGTFTDVFARFAPAASIHDQSVMDTWLQPATGRGRPLTSCPRQGPVERREAPAVKGWPAAGQ